MQTKNENNKILIIFAGLGALPLKIARHYRNSHAILFHGLQYSAEWQEIPHLKIHIGELGLAINLIKKLSAGYAVMAGDMVRPKFSDIKQLDAEGRAFIGKNTMAFLKGDDGLLSLLSQYISEKTGIEWLSPNQILGIERAVGLLAGSKPSDDDMRSAMLGCQFLRAVSPFDSGQAVVVGDGRVIAFEGIEGTDGLLARCAPYHYESGVLVKDFKQAQNKALDVPTMGLHTLQGLKLARLRGVFFSNQGNILDEDKTIDFANKEGLFIYLFH